MGGEERGHVVWRSGSASACGISIVSAESNFEGFRLDELCLSYLGITSPLSQLCTITRAQHESLHPNIAAPTAEFMQTIPFIHRQDANRVFAGARCKSQEQEQDWKYNTKKKDQQSMSRSFSSSSRKGPNFSKQYAIRVQDPARQRQEQHSRFIIVAHSAQRWTHAEDGKYNSRMAGEWAYLSFIDHMSDHSLKRSSAQDLGRPNRNQTGSGLDKTKPLHNTHNCIHCSAHPVCGEASDKCIELRVRNAGEYSQAQNTKDDDHDVEREDVGDTESQAQDDADHARPTTRLPKAATDGGPFMTAPSAEDPGNHDLFSQMLQRRTVGQQRARNGTEKSGKQGKSVLKFLERSSSARVMVPDEGAGYR
ncbi:uncharacterized protein An16g04570 [Aspergillus niger]|uniref:Contig An16c0170, genomic contig n=2 Tax=Aspergillus niger TaxID=5061 RepID=A2R7S6_ASPNC|nr:uncharacterized protein An16g04570 [Aspergillus niger]CAK42887.1 unnamed protein product [Aspergillus niger]